MRKIGLIINPLAGLGGPLGLKGSDDLKIDVRTFTEGMKASALERMFIALETMQGAPLHLVTCEGAMGAAVVSRLGFQSVEVLAVGDGVTTAEDTKIAVRLLLEAEVELIVFAGGDGTARDIASVCGHQVPIVGVPAGVKMHSAVFAKTPRDCGMLVLSGIERGFGRLVEAEVMDLDEGLYRQGIIAPRLYGTVQVPYDPSKLQSKKSRSAETEKSAQADIAWEVINRMDSGLYFLGPGTTTHEICVQLGEQGTLIGVDAILDKKIIARDLSESDLMDLMRERQARCILTPVGGQGFLLGRGNQQLSPAVIQAIAKNNLIVVATKSKLQALCGQPLLLDTGDARLDQALSGYVRVITGLKEECVYPLGEQK